MFKKILIILLILKSSVFAEVVKEIKIEGNDRISFETIKLYGDIELGKNYSENELNDTLKKLYSTNFFENIEIKLNNNILNINVQEYQLINNISLQGEPSKRLNNLILENLSLKAKGSYIKNIVNEDIEKIKQVYSLEGYNFVKIDLKTETFSDKRVNLNFIVDKGNKTYIKQINFIGDKKIKTSRLRDIIVSEEYKFWKFISRNTFLNFRNVELDKRLLINYYKSLGYYDVQILSDYAFLNKKDNYTTLTYTVNAGTRYKVKKISTSVSKVIDQTIFLPLSKNYEALVGKYYSPFKVKKLLDQLDSLIASKDLQFIEHSVNEIIESDSIEIKINIFEGNKELIEKINLIGNNVTDEAVIRAELLVDEGDPNNTLKLEQSINRLKSRNIFGEVSYKILDGSNKDLKVIEINVTEKPTGEISTGAGIGTNGGSFSFAISDNNWLGKGISVSTSLALSSETATGEISFNNPNYNYSGNSLIYYISNSVNDKPDSGYKNKIFSSGIGTKFEQYKNLYVSPNLIFSYDDLKVDGTASNALKKQKGTFSELSFDYSIITDNRDRIYGPTEGFLTSFSQVFPIFADVPYVKNTFSHSAYKSVTPNAVTSFKFFASSVNSLNNEDVRLSKRIFLSNNRLRGFEYGKLGPKDGQDFVGGNYAVSTSVDLNLPNLLPESTKTDVGIFLDVGNLWGVDYNKSINDSNEIRSTAGLTTNWLSPVGPVSFILSQNITKAKTDVTESFNFRLGTTF